jgi:hypothetical protein
VQTLACPIAGAAPPDPAVLAALARQTLGLPSPVIRSSPAQNALQLTNLPTWLWINPAEWVPESKTATVPGESIGASADGPHFADLDLLLVNDPVHDPPRVATDD